MKSIWSIFKNYIIPIAVGLAIALLIKTYAFSLVKVDGSSMYPNLQNTEPVSMIKFLEPKRDNVVVFKAYGVDPRAIDPKILYVKRVIGVPGDTVQYTKSGELLVNNKVVKQDFISKDTQKQGTLQPINKEKTGFDLKSLSKGSEWNSGSVTTVPKGKYFVMGDNREVSNDSRYWGFVPKDKIQGVVKLLPWQNHHEEINR